MTQISNADDLWRWFNGQSRDVVSVICARAALRVFPQIFELIHRDSIEDTALICLRAMALGWIPCVDDFWARGSENLKNHAVHAYDAFLLEEIDANDLESRVIRDDYRASFLDAAMYCPRILYQERSYSHDTSMQCAQIVISAAERAFSNWKEGVRSFERKDELELGFSDSWNEVVIDCLAFEKNNYISVFKNRPIWSSNSIDRYARIWDKNSKEYLLSVDENWKYWIGWYRDRLFGTPTVMPLLEIERVFIDSDDWEQGPARVNALIQALEDEYRGVDPNKVGVQEPIGTLFSDDGPEIERSFGGLQQRPSSGEVAEDFHASLREALDALIAATGDSGRTNNRFTDVTSLSRRLLEAIGSGPASVRPAQTIAQAGKLDRAAQADDRRRHDPDLEGPALSADEREALDNAVDAAKTYINTDPVLGPMEQARLGKAQVPIDDALVRDIVEAAAEEGAATEDAKEAVEDAAEAGPEGANSRFYGATVLNFMRAALRIGAKYSFTAKAGIKVARWLVKHKTKILALLDPWPDMRNIADRIIALLEKLPLD